LERLSPRNQPARLRARPNIAATFRSRALARFRAQHIAPYRSDARLVEPLGVCAQLHDVLRTQLFDALARPRLRAAALESTLCHSTSVL
jgi:hypothetical protein